MKMESKTPYIGLAVVAIGLLIVGVALLTSGGDLLVKHEVSNEQPEANMSVAIGDNATLATLCKTPSEDEVSGKNYDDDVTLVTPSEDELLGKYEKSDRFLHEMTIKTTRGDKNGK